MSEFRECLMLAMLCWVWHAQEDAKVVKILAALGAMVWTVAAVLALVGGGQK